MRLDALPEIALAVAQERTAEAVLGRIVRGLAADPSVGLARIWLIGPGDQCDGCRMRADCEDTSRCLHLVASAGTPLAHADEDWSRTTGAYRRIPLSSGSKMSLVATTGEALLVSDLAPALATSPLMRPEWARAEGIVCFAGQPLLFRGEVLGMFGVFLRAQVGPEAMRALRAFADQAAAAIANARALDAITALQAQLAGERDRLAVLLDVARAVNADLTLSALIETMARVLRPVAPHAINHLALRQGDEPFLRLHTLVREARDPRREGLPIPIEGTPAGRAFLEQRPFVARSQQQILDGIGFEPLRVIVTAEGIRSGCIVPLVSRGRALGTLGFGSTEEGAFDPAMVELMVQIGAIVAPAVDNALAYERLDELKRQLEKEKGYLEDELRTERSFDEIVGHSPSLQTLLAGIETVAATGSTVLVQGETGTGKELVARAIHRLSGRGERTFVKLNCAAIPTGLLESELFGHEKGAFTGAIAAKAGRFELAHKGSLFLDEIGEIAPELQPKLLRVLQDQEFERLGGTKTIKVDVRVIAATNRDLAQMVAARQFRSDLFYRLNVFPLTVPPLRERTGDVGVLARHFVQRLARGMGKRIDTIPPEALAALERYPWPGNVRELQNLIERSVILTRGAVLEVPLAALAVAPPAPPTAPPTPVSTPSPVTSVPATALPAIDAAERDVILAALTACGWRVGGERGAAARLGISRTTLQSKMLRLGIARPGS